MGEAHARAVASAAAANAVAQSKAIPLTLKQGVVVKAIELACHVLAGIAHQLLNDWKEPEPAVELQKSIEHLSAWGKRYIVQTESKVVLAQPADVPKVTL
jgi:hypothetical protein